MLFELTQILYAIANLSYDILYLKKSNIVKRSDGEPLKSASINSLISVYHEPINIIRNNILSQLASNYPKNLINIYLIVEKEDIKTVGYVDVLSKEFENVHGIIIPPNGEGDWDDVVKVSGLDTFDLPFGKGRALLYAYYTKRSNVAGSDVITIYDAEDIIDPDLVKSALAGLERGYDIIQGKIRYRNGGNGLLVALESAEPVIWSNVIYPHTSHSSVPFQVLGPAYFMRSILPGEVGGWNPFTTSEDVDFGFRVWANGGKIAILDIYTSELGVESLSSWFNQRRRWVRGHQKAFFSPYLNGKTWFETAKNKFNFWTYSLNSQLMSITSVVGVPAGIYQVINTLGGHSPDLTFWVKALAIYNLAHWITAFGLTCYYIENSQALSLKEKIKFYLRMNPITTLLYNMLWALPVIFGIKDCLSRKRISWEHTVREEEIIKEVT